MKLFISILLITFLPAFSSCTNGNHEGVAIYLIENDIHPQQLSTLDHLELADTPFLTEKEIISYQKETHEIDLTADGIKKLQKMDIPVTGTAFALCVNHEPIYTGAFWKDYSSVSYNGVVINTTLVSQEIPTIRIQLGYPNASFFRGDDPRSDPRILEELQKAGKLR